MNAATKDAGRYFCKTQHCHEMAYGDSNLCIDHQLGSRETYVLATWYSWDHEAKKYLPDDEGEPELLRASVGPKRLTVWLPRGTKVVMRSGFDWSPVFYHFFARDRTRAWRQIKFEVVI